MIFSYGPALFPCTSNGTQNGIGHHAGLQIIGTSYLALASQSVSSCNSKLDAPGAGMISLMRTAADCTL